MAKSLTFVQDLVARRGAGLVDRNSSSWWQQRQAAMLDVIRTAANAQQLIHDFQTSSISGFDHRVSLDNCDSVPELCRYKWSGLKRIFPAFAAALEGVEEAEQSLLGSIVFLHERRVSNIFLSHLGFYLFITQAIQPRTILEIGGGYGSLARIFCTLNKPTTYVIVDVPSSLLCAYVFLRETMPEIQVELIDRTDLPNASDSSRVILVPAELAVESVLGAMTYDLAINTGSFQEMPAKRCAYFQHLIFELLKVRAVYSHNYFLNADAVGREMERGQDELPLVPQFPSDYRVFAAVLNNPVFDIDASGRNWLETLLVSKSADMPRRSLSVSARVLHRAVESICRSKPIGLMSYLTSYSLLAKFYCGGSVPLPPEWGGRVSTNCIGIPGAFPDVIESAKELHAWFNRNIMEIRQLRAQLGVSGGFVRSLLDKVEIQVIKNALDRYRSIDRARTARKGLPSIGNMRVAAYSL